VGVRDGSLELILHQVGAMSEVVKLFESGHPVVQRLFQLVAESVGINEIAKARSIVVVGAISVVDAPLSDPTRKLFKVPSLNDSFSVHQFLLSEKRAANGFIKACVRWIRLCRDFACPEEGFFFKLLFYNSPSDIRSEEFLPDRTPSTRQEFADNLGQAVQNQLCFFDTSKREFGWPREAPAVFWLVSWGSLLFAENACKIVLDVGRRFNMKLEQDDVSFYQASK